MENQNNFADQFSVQEVIRLSNSPAGRQLIDLLRRQDSSSFQSAMESACAGQYQDAKQIIEKLLSDPEAQKLLKQLRG